MTENQDEVGEVLIGALEYYEMRYGEVRFCTKCGKRLSFLNRGKTCFAHRVPKDAGRPQANEFNEEGRRWTGHTTHR